MSELNLRELTVMDIGVSVPLALLLIIAPDWVARIAGGPGAVFYLAVGSVMLLWCVDMLMLVLNDRWMQRFSGVMWVVDSLWGLISAALCVLYFAELTYVGVGLFLLNVLVPAAMAMAKTAQIRQARHSSRSPSVVVSGGLS